MATFLSVSKGILERAIDRLALEVLPAIHVKTERGLRKTAEFVRDEAVKRAPVDTGKLERNIRVRKESSSKFSVISDAEEQGVQYAAFLHENPNWNLGKGSQRKQAGQSERVGNKWLERAVSDNPDKIKEIFREDLILVVGRRT